MNIKYLAFIIFFCNVFSSSNIPPLFKYNQGTFQAFYFFKEVAIDSMKIDANDWVGTFNCTKWNDDSTSCMKLGPCVGSRQYNYALCGGGICDLPAMGAGDESSERTQGYLKDGEFPVFLIYGQKQGVYYQTVPSGDVRQQKETCRNGYPFCYGWKNFGFIVSERLDGKEIYMDCSGKLGGDKIIDECSVCGGSGPQYLCELNNISYCTEYEYQQKCIK